jgi:hypothetical protein
MTADVLNAAPVTYTPESIDPQSLYFSVAAGEIHCGFSIMAGAAKKGEETLTFSGQDYPDFLAAANGYGPEGSDVNLMFLSALKDLINQADAAAHTLAEITPLDIYLDLANSRLYYRFEIAGQQRTLNWSGQAFLNAIGMANSYGPAGSDIYNMLRRALYDMIGAQKGWELSVV